MAITIDAPQGEAALEEFIRFHDSVYSQHTAYWPAPVDLQLPILRGDSPFARDRRIRPLWARDNGEIVARAAAVVDQRYIRHWNEPLGHIVMFEALPEAREATRALMDAACTWLAQQGSEAARTGMGMLDFPYLIDAYDILPPSLLRQNPAYYHVLIKQAGFEAEQGFVDYKIRVTPALIERWQRALDAARHVGYRIVPVKEIERARRNREFTATWNETFRAHWGWTPFVEDEIGMFFDAFVAGGIQDTSVLAYEGDEAVGMLFVNPDDPQHAVLAPGRNLDPAEKLNVLGIGVRARARGRGLNYAMAAHAFLELVRRGATYVSYTLVLDDNWPSRRTGEGLGAYLCANYLAYRRNFRR
jgi:GNAT superfamily N-acetyltransferase